MTSIGPGQIRKVGPFQNAYQVFQISVLNTYDVHMGQLHVYLAELNLEP